MFLTNLLVGDGRHRRGEHVSGRMFVMGHTLRHLLVLCHNGTIAAWAQRAWGSLMADWARVTDWGVHYNKRGDRCGWHDTDFYTNLGSHVIADYERWCEMVRQVLARKTERMLAQPAR